MELDTLLEWAFDIGLGLLLVFAAVMIGIALVLYFSQEKIIYCPSGDGLTKLPQDNPHGYRDPSEQLMPFEDVELTTSDDVKLRGWFIKQSDDALTSSSITIVFFHENAGNLGNRLSFLSEYYQRVKCNILIVAYRGFSNSDGEPSEKGLEYDSLAILDYVFNTRKDIDSNKIFIHGKSLGGAVAIYACRYTNYPIAGLIIENTFTSISDMIDDIFPHLKYFKRIVQRNFWPSIERIGHLNLPLLFIISWKDEMVDPRHMARLWNQTGELEIKLKYIIEEGSHNTGWSLDPDEYFDSINNFIVKCNRN